ncbi:MAG: ATP-binding cassette domain-containing protein [Acholeplasmatales bacterium]|jgi:ABC-2 type transport system ATP-binding protein|nr:ATP-binding cassette domain-containing protein [Acholeplasmatales bacterium]
MGIILQTNNLTKIYKDKKVVDNLNMTINEGDIYGFVGENGAGKTTLIRLVTKVILPTSGTFSVLPSHNRYYGDVSAIVETPSLNTNMSAYDNLYNQFILINRRDYENINDILKSVGLDDVINDPKKVGKFSLGMKQRLAVAMSIAGNPKFLVLDEPMNGLDPEGIVGLRNLIIKLNKEQHITFLISSHILDELAKVATRFGFIHKGKIVKELTSTELHASNNKRVCFTLSDVSTVKDIFSKLNINNYVINDKDKIVTITGDIVINDIMKALVNNDITVIKMENIDESIEDYYLKLIGGNRNV